MSISAGVNRKDPLEVHMSDLHREKRPYVQKKTREDEPPKGGTWQPARAAALSSRVATLPLWPVKGRLADRSSTVFKDQ